MGLILKNKIKQLLKGYPTVSDKYNVAGGINADTAAMDFGEVIAVGDQTGWYKKLTAKTDVIAGICMAKNVKLVTVYPADGAQAQIMPGEAIDLFVDGYIAVEIAVDLSAILNEDGSFKAGKTIDDIYTAIAALGITEGATAYVDATTGKFGLTAGDNGIEYGKFTGITEYNYGKALAEIVVK